MRAGTKEERYRRLFVGQLDAEREQLLKEVRLLANGGGIELLLKFEDDGSYPTEVASSQAARELALAQLDLARSRLSEVERAIDRLETGSFGRCEVCGNQIPIARLRALPWARRCVACQAQRDNRSSRPVRHAA